MCNIYKNNLITLSQVQNNELLYINENKILVDDRYFTSFRQNNIQEIFDCINLSFITIVNNYILNIIEDEKNIELLDEEDLNEVKNTKDLLKSSFNGLLIYKKTLEYNRYNNDIISKFINNLTTIIDNLDILRDKYVLSVQSKKSDETNKKSIWNYLLFNSSINNTKSKLIIKEPEPLKETDNISNNQDINNDTFNDESNNEYNEFYEENDSYIINLLYIVSRKITNVFKCVGKHISILFKH